MRKFIVISYGIGFLFGLYFIDVFLNLSFYVENIHSEVLQYSSIKTSKEAIETAHANGFPPKVEP